jgi:hypothetical protein
MMTLSNELSRRRFLQAAAATAAVATTGVTAQAKDSKTAAYPEHGMLVPDDGWRLWVDEKAAWKDDTIYLPEDVRAGGRKDLATLPVNPPTGGWGVLGGDGLAVTLPTTVEQHLWGKFGLRSYTPEEYRYAADDPIPQNGAYLGVSWWYRSLEIPAAMRGKRIFLHVRGARLRAEVYLNERLVGYSIMEELPFECDLTEAAKPGGENRLAIRITNPFGRYDWVDGLNAQWGAVKFYRSHGFGGLDRGMTVSSVGKDDARIAEAWVLNRLEPRTVEVHARLNTPAGGVAVSDRTRLRYLKVEVVDPETGKKLPVVVQKSDMDGEGESARYTLTVTCASAALWELEAPKLYHLRVFYQSPKGEEDSRTIAMGFRTFVVTGLGTDAMFRMNGRRRKIYTSISWGFWGLNGLWPTPELAEKEVTQAKKLNLTCLNFHRNLAKEDVLRAQDRLGLLRHLEPGAGKLAIARMAKDADPAKERPESAAEMFARRFMVVKCVAMVKAFRSHPSVIEYCLQNEIGADLKNPDVIGILEAMRAEDPSRLIVLNDGFVAPPRKAAQAWFEPWNPTIHRSDKEEWGGWWNQHQGAGDQWYDEFYKSPTEFTYQSPVHKQISEFGEMEGCATPDNHSLMLSQIAKRGGQSYDRVDHQEIVTATDRWLERWGFRKAFPATEMLWLSIGKKCYDTWQNYLENARISDDLDYAAISGWESTVIENHSGIVDNMRNFKSDPTPIAATLQPVRPVAKQRSVCTGLGETAVFDLFLLNDTGRAVAGTLRFEAVSPSGTMLRLGEFPVPAQTTDVFSYLVKEGFTTPPLTEVGMYRFRFALSSMPLVTQVKEIWVTGGVQERFRALRVGVSGVTPALRKQLEGLAKVEEFRAGGRYDAIVSSGLTATTSARQEAGDTTGLEAQPVAKPNDTPTVPGRKLEPGEGPEVAQTGHLEAGILEAVRAGTPLLAIPQADTLSEGVAKQLAAAGAFTYHGTVGDFRAPWMGNWYFVRQHPVYAGMPVDQAMGVHYQARGRQSNGLLVEGPEVEIVVGYSRDHDRHIGAGTFTTKLGGTKVLYQRVPELHPVLQRRFLENALAWLTVKS